MWKTKQILRHYAGLVLAIFIFMVPYDVFKGLMRCKTATCDYNTMILQGGILFAVWLGICLSLYFVYED